MPGLSRPCIGIIAQLFPHSLCIMHKTDFFHFLHKRPKSSFWRFGEFAHILGSCWQCVHSLYVFWKCILCFWLVFGNFCWFRWCFYLLARPVFITNCNKKP